MDEGIYRDALAGLRARVQEREAEVRAREAELPASVWSALPEAEVERLRGVKRETELATEGLDSLARLADALGRYRDELDKLIACLPELEALLAKPSLEPPPVSMSWRSGSMDISHFELPLVALEAQVRELVLPYDDVELTRHPPYGHGARFSSHGVRLALAIGLTFDGTHLFSEKKHVLATSVARGAPELRLAPESVGHGVRRWFGRWDPEVGDIAFDGQFQVGAEEPATHPLLTREVRSALLALAHYDVPQLVVADGEATLRWKYDIEPRALAAGVRALVALRAVPVRAPVARPQV